MKYVVLKLNHSKFILEEENFTLGDDIYGVGGGFHIFVLIFMVVVVETFIFLC